MSIFRPKTTPVIACKKCDASIVLVKTRAKSRFMPCNPGMRAAAAGLVTVTLDGHVIVGARDGVTGLEPHHPSCLERQAKMSGVAA